MSEKYKFHYPEGIYFITLTVILDRLFHPQRMKACYYRIFAILPGKKWLIIYGWCLRESHLQLIISTEKDSLEAILRDFKMHTNRQLKKQFRKLMKAGKNGYYGLLPMQVKT